MAFSVPQTQGPPCPTETSVVSLKHLTNSEGRSLSQLGRPHHGDRGEEEDSQTLHAEMRPSSWKDLSQEQMETSFLLMEEIQAGPKNVSYFKCTSAKRIGEGPNST